MRRTTLVIRVGKGTMRAEVVRGRSVVWVAESGFVSREDLAAALGALGQEPAATDRSRAARVELEGPIVQVRTLQDLPPVRRPALRALVAHQAGRFFRKNGAPLVTDAMWKPRKRGVPRAALAAAAEEPWVDAILEGMRVAGIEPATVSPAGSGLELLPPAEQKARRTTTRKRTRRLATTAVVVWGVVGGLAVRREVRESAMVDRELASLAPAAAAARRVRQEYDGAEAMITTLEATAQRRGGLTARAAAILAGLPDSAYLTSLHLHDDAAGEISGAARRPLDVIAALDRTKAVAGPRLAESGVRIPVGGRDYEGFTVRFGPDSAR